MEKSTRFMKLFDAKILHSRGLNETQEIVDDIIIGLAKFGIEDSQITELSYDNVLGICVNIYIDNVYWGAYCIEKKMFLILRNKERESVPNTDTLLIPCYQKAFKQYSNAPCRVMKEQNWKKAQIIETKIKSELKMFGIEESKITELSYEDSSEAEVNIFINNIHWGSYDCRSDDILIKQYIGDYRFRAKLVDNKSQLEAIKLKN